MKWLAEKDRRKRIQVDIPLQFRLLKAKGSAVKGALTRDISTGGVKFVSDIFLPIMDKLFISIEVSPSKTINILARVIWAATIPHSDRYDIGAEFIGVDEDAAKELKDMVNKI